MGLRFRTPIGSLREQRRKAEGQLPQTAGRAPATRYRNAESLGDHSTDSQKEFEGVKRDSLIERLRSVLASERPDTQEAPSEYEVIQDELARISQHQQIARQDGGKNLADLDVPRSMFFDAAAPFRYVVINGGKTVDEDFGHSIPKLSSAPSNLDSYVHSIRRFDEPVPRAMPLTLLLNSDVEPIAPQVKADPSHDAAQLTQNNVTYSAQPKERAFIPKSLILSLLEDK